MSATRRFAGNLTAVMTSDILNKGTTFLIYILVARALGTYAFGQMSLALTLFYSFQVIATFGMQTLITREVAKDGGHSGKYFASSLLVGLSTSLAAMALLAGAVILLNYPADTRDIILITSLGLVPFAIGTICEAVIRGWERMHLIAFVQVPVNLAKVLVTCYLLWAGGDIFQVVLVIVGSRFAIALALLFITVRNLRPWQTSYWDLSFAKSIARRSTTFVGIDTVTALWTSLNIVLLSKLASETDVGLYNAANQLMIPMGIFYQSVMVAAFPIMCRKFTASADSLRKVSNHLIELLLAMAIPGAVGLYILAEPALEAVYGGDNFLRSASVLRITVFVLIIRALTFALGHVLLAGSRESTTLRIVVVDLIFGFVLGWILISNFGLIGAAWAALLTRVVDFVQHLGPVRNIVTQIEIRQVIWKPVVASVAMAVYLLLVKDQNIAFSVLTGALVYAICYLGVEFWSAGSLRNLRARYAGVSRGTPGN